MKKIIIIDDHQLLREGINSWVSSNSDWQILAKLGNLEEVKAFILDLDAKNYHKGAR